MIQQYSADYLRQIDKVDWQNPVNWNHSLNNGLVSWWLAVPNHLGFGTNTWVDLCGRNHGMLTNMDAASDWVAENQQGRWGHLDFDGTDDFVEFNPVGIFDGSKNWTVSIWANPSVLVGNAMIWHPRAERDIFIRLANAAGTPIQFAFVSSGTKSITTIDPNIGSWYHCVMVWNVTDSLVYVYVNNISYGSIATSTPTARSDKNTVGAQYFSGVPNNEFGGKINDYRLYNRALAVSEVETLYKNSQSYYLNLLNRNRIKRYFVPSGGGGVTATASGSGSGTGSASATVVVNAVSAGSGSGTGAATATVDIQASASGSGSGTGAATATVIIVATANGSGSGDGAIDVTPTVQAVAAGSGSGDGAATAVVTINATASGSGSGDGAATATVQIASVASGSGGGTGAATATITISATASGSGSGTGVVIVSGVPVVYDVTIAVAAVGAVALTSAAVGAVALTSAAVGAVAITLGADMHHVGDTLKITGTFTLDGTETDPTSVSLQVRDPSENVATYTYPSQVSKESTGVYSYNLLLDEDGIWFVKWVGEGAVVTATEDTKLKVERTRFTYPPA